MIKLKGSNLMKDPYFKEENEIVGCTMTQMNESIQRYYMVAASSGAEKVFKAAEDSMQGLVDMKNLPQMKTFVVEKNRAEKDAELSVQARQEGNAAYTKRDLASALKFYNDSIRLSPADTESTKEQLAFAFGNRSAVLLEMGRYKDCVNDIARAVLAGYPKDKWDKLLTRRRKCMANLTQEKIAHGDDLRAQQNEQLVLDEDQNRVKEESEAKRKEAGRAGGDAGEEDFDLKTWKELSSWDFGIRYESNVPKLSDVKDSNYWNMSCAIELKANEETGRHFVAKRDIAPGEILIVEPPYCAVMDGRYWLTHCQNCMERTDIVVPCQTCASVIFCSEDCRNMAARYHYLECPIIGNLADSQMCIRLDNLRSVSKHPLILLQGMRERLQQLINDHVKNPKRVSSRVPNLPGSSDDLENSFALMSHVTDRTENVYEHALSALYLFKALEATSYFSGCDPEYEEQDRELALKLLHLACLIRSTNTYTIVEDKLKVPDLWDSERVRLGAGLYPLGSYLNHACDPNTTRDFAYGCLIVAASCPISRGDEITALYYKTFQDAPRQQRLNFLKQNYLFTCKCMACERRWPTGNDMQKDPTKLLVRCPRCFKIQRLGDPLTMTKCPSCQGDLERYSDQLSSAWSAVLKTFGRMEKGDKKLAHRAPYIMAEYMKLSSSLILPPDGDFYFAKGLFCRSMRIIRGLVREEKKQVEEAREE